MTNKKPCCRITGGFFKNYQELVRTVSIPYQWKILNDWIPGAEKSGAVHNLKLAAKLAQGEYYGTCFQDSDVGKCCLYPGNKTRSKTGSPCRLRYSSSGKSAARGWIFEQLFYR